ncbi:unnamed protein product [Withania somnifera]
MQQDFFAPFQISSPTGPKPWPIIRNLNLIGNLPHRSIHELFRKYGPIMQLRFGSFPVVVGSNVEVAKIFLKSMDINFVDRPKMAAGKYTAYNYSDISWAPYGPYWRQARRICVMELFSPKRIDSYGYIRAEELHSLLHNLNRLSGKPILLKDYLKTLSLNIISRMVLGKKSMDEPHNSIKNMPGEMIWLNAVLNIGDAIPAIDFMDLQGYVKRMKVVSKKFDSFLEDVLNEHNARRKVEDNNVAKDMVDVLLQLADDPSLEVKLERQGVKAFTQDLLAAGTESSAVTVEWAISELLKKPEIFNKATEELDRVIGQNRWALKPDRFLGKCIDVKGHDFELLPFGAGRRMCPGYSLGLKVVQATTANLLHGFKWSLPDNMTPEDLNMEEMFGLSIPRKTPLVAVIEPRLPLNLYSA